MYHEIKCNSNEQKDYINLVAPYYNAINPTKIFFEKEKVIATIDSLGHIEFFDMEENSLGFVDFPVSDDPSEKGHTAQYGNAKYLADDNKIYFQSYKRHVLSKWGFL